MTVKDEMCHCRVVLFWYICTIRSVHVEYIMQAEGANNEHCEKNKREERAEGSKKKPEIKTITSNSTRRHQRRHIPSMNVKVKAQF